MNADIIKGNWTKLKGQVQEQWGELTNDQLDRIEGNRKQLVGEIQRSYGVAREEAEHQVAEWERRFAA